VCRSSTPCSVAPSTSANKYLVLSGSVPAGASLDAAQKAGVVLAWGNFVTVVINFVLLALVIFWMVKAVNRVRASVEAEQPAVPAARRGGRGPAAGDTRRAEAAVSGATGAARANAS